MVRSRAIAYSGVAMFHDRMNKTFDKLRAGQLPPPTAVRTLMKTATCSGCGEIIEPRERYVRVRGVTPLRFHIICHEAWVRFKPSQQAQ
jgi:hypothetical protein